MPFSNKRNSRDDKSKNSRSTSENFKPRGDRSKDDRSSNFKENKRPRSSSFGNKDNTDRPYNNDKKSFGGDRPFKKFDGENSDRKRSFDKPFNKEGKSFGGDRPFRKEGDSSDRKRSFDKPFNKEGRSFGGDRPFRKEGDSSDRKRSFDKPFNKEGRSFGGDRPFRKEGESSDRKRSFDKPFNKEGRSFGGDRPFRKEGESSDRKRTFDKPFNKEGRSFGGERPFRKEGDSSDRKRTFDKPFNKEGKSFQKSDGDQTDFKRPARDKSDRQYKSSYKKFNNDEDRKEGSTERRSTERPQRSKSSQNDGLIRLNRYIANSGVCSRRKADELIAAGVVSVNGEAVTELGAKVDPAKDDVKYNGERLKREKMVYVLLNKPKDYITTTEDPQERHTVMELVSKATKERIYPVGRLDRNTTGLLLMTNDGNLAEKLSHPRNNISKIYNVELNKSLTQGDFNKIVFGLELEDGFVKPDDLSYVTGGSKREVGVQIHSGKNRIVRRIFESLGYEVVKLDRVVYANLTKKDLPRGRWRYIEERELVQLKHLI
ncbi:MULTISPECIES: pseudouridine synthase [unclassified Sphingobacterium]|uniref:pseudouridine synthase n=1 Tax=unclassified Sphingobacterium TaxID=2609468 RepID=UPI00143A14D8|nr:MULTISPECIES: pseudouridine synthase [unclassified Sphingobacterium]MBB2953694.1 23S rRNA pseudouridine2605 synthase [Sphingobacterium sp. JUb56]NJI73617.1 rRNA pseudouridine synthase [Sphingobacterium sp. B16(2022)]